MKTKAQPIDNHILTRFTVKLTHRLAKQIRVEYKKEQIKRKDWPYMLALQPNAASGEIRVNIISDPLGKELADTIEKYIRIDARSRESLPT
jgi:hypothetical protein